LEEEPEWVKQAKSSGDQRPSVEQTPVTPQAPEEIVPTDDMSSWLKSLDEEEETQETKPVAEDDTATWLKTLDKPEEIQTTTESTSDDLPAWIKGIEDEKKSAGEAIIPLDEAEPEVEEPVPAGETEEIPSWLSGLEEEKTPSKSESDDFPAWMRDETGEVVAEPTKIEPARPADWKPVEEEQKAEAMPLPPVVPSEQARIDEPAPESTVEPTLAPVFKKKPAIKKEEIKPATPPEPYIEPVTRRATGMQTMPVDPILGSARNELSRSNIPGALETYGKLIKKGRFLEEVIYDLREALYRYPVEVSIWQTLGDAYMRANQLQDALDAYTKAEELLR